MIRKKPWLPVLREKERYVHFRLGVPLPAEEAKRIMLRAIENYIGVLGLARAKFRLVDFSGKEGIFQTTAQSLSEVIASLSLLDCAFASLSVSGTLKKVK